MSSILVIGRGFIGTKLYTYLAEKKLSVLSISQKVINYTNEQDLFEYLKKNNFSHVINCCGYTGVPNVDGCELNKDMCWKYNVTIASTIDRICAQFNIKCMHVSSGCIYSGYEKEYEETDIPNFGLFNSNSSFYSKSKHAFETVYNKNNSAILRIRMPFTPLRENKNYLYKLLKYDNLISYKNSLTSVEDLCEFIYKFVDAFAPGIYNVVNPNPLDAQEITSIMKKYGKINVNWKFVEVKDLNIIAGRSNCTLSSNKLKSLGLCLPDSHASLDKCIKEL